MKKSKKSLSHFSEEISEKGLNTIKGGENTVSKRTDTTEAENDPEYIILLILIAC